MVGLIEVDMTQLHVSDDGESRRREDITARMFAATKCTYTGGGGSS